MDAAADWEATTSQVSHLLCGAPSHSTTELRLTSSGGKKDVGLHLLVCILCHTFCVSQFNCYNAGCIRPISPCYIIRLFGSYNPFYLRSCWCFVNFSEWPVRPRPARPVVTAPRWAPAPPHRAVDSCSKARSVSC